MLLALAVVLGLLASSQAYTGQFDNIDIEELLRNEILLKRYLMCFKGQGVCTPDGKEIKELIPDGLVSECGKCTDKQKANIDHVVKYLVEHKRSDFEDLEKLYDPECIYRKQYKEHNIKLGIDLGEC